MARAPSPDGPIKLTPERPEKVAFIAAAAKARQSLNQWLIEAGIERATREGVPVGAERKRKGAK